MGAITYTENKPQKPNWTDYYIPVRERQTLPLISYYCNYIIWCYIYWANYTSFDKAIAYLFFLFPLFQRFVLIYCINNELYKFNKWKRMISALCYTSCIHNTRQYFKDFLHNMIDIQIKIGQGQKRFTFSLD